MPLDGRLAIDTKLPAWPVKICNGDNRQGLSIDI